jgi:hypothetical protein
MGVLGKKAFGLGKRSTESFTFELFFESFDQKCAALALAHELINGFDQILWQYDVRANSFGSHNLHLEFRTYFPAYIVYRTGVGEVRPIEEHNEVGVAWYGNASMPRTFVTK